MNQSMNQSLRCLTLSLVGLAAVLVPHSAAAGNAPLVADAYTSSAQPTSNFGAKTSLLVQGPPAKSSLGVAYLQFDLSTLPTGTSGSDVAKATLTLGVNKVTVPGAFDVFRVLGSPDAWSETGLTDSTAPPLAGTAEVSGAPVASTDKNDFKTIDITQLVKDWLDGVLPNNGVALVPNVAGLAVALDSKESTSTSHWAQLDVELRTVNSLSAGSGLSVSSSTGDVTLSVSSGGVTNSMLAHPSVTVTAGAGLSGGGAVALGGSTTLNNAGVLSVGASAPLASSGGQTPSVSLTGIVPVANGGTGASTASAALGNLGAAASGANIDITSLKGASFPSNNTAVGSGALLKTTGPNNTGIGTSALSANTTSQDNTAVGAFSLSQNTTGSLNTAVGKYSLTSNTTANWNSALGTDALRSNITGDNSTAIGARALTANTSGFGNTALGSDALSVNTTGSTNIAVGRGAGDALTTGSLNIDIGNVGVAGEGNTIRVGTAGTQTATYIAGINGSTVNGSGVAVDSNGRLGTAPASVLGLCVPNPTASLRFVDNGDGTVTDLKTCLMWEKKTGTVGGSTDYNNPENVNNSYTWSASGTAADGTGFTDFLPRVNGTLCSTSSCPALGGHSDWRLPTSAELQTILLTPYPCGTNPCVDPTFGPTQSNAYWSATTYAGNPAFAWLVTFYDGYVTYDGKSYNLYVRAVRGGS